MIPVAQSEEYERAARAAGKAITAVHYDGIGHMATVVPESKSDARKRAIAFLHEHLSK